MFQKAAVIVVEELTGRADGESDGLVSAQRVPARSAVSALKKRPAKYLRFIPRGYSEPQRKRSKKRPTANVQRSMKKRVQQLSAPDDLTQLLERGSLGFFIIVITPGNDFEHLSSHISLPFPDSIETAHSGPVFVIDHSGLRRRSIPIAVENMKRAAIIFENIGANRQGDIVDGEKFVLHGSALRHAAGGKADVRPVILDEETGGAAREPAKEKHVPVVAIIARPRAAAALVVAQKLLSVIRDWHRL